MKKQIKNSSLLILISSSIIISGCFQSTRPEEVASLNVNTSYNFSLPEDVTTNHLRDPFIKTGIEALIDNDYEVASSAFNHALKFEPQNAYLHFLNGFTYHLMAYQGDYSKTKLAEVGYQLARQFDNTAWWVEYFSGLLALENKRYDAAQAYFVDTLTLDQNNIEAMKGLAIASYYLGDIKTAYLAIGKAIDIEQNDPVLLRSAALVHAAAGDQIQSKRHLDHYKNQNPADYKFNHTAARVSDWVKVYEKQKNNTLLATKSVPINGSGQQPAEYTAESIDASSYKQLIVDVIIIRSEERITNRRGINLLDGLSLTFGATDVKTITDWKGNDIGNFQNETGAFPQFNIFSFPNVFTRTLSIPTVTYSLNMFNTLNDRHEIIARPSLTALDGNKSTFFSGAELNVGFAGTLQGGNLDKKEVGVTLEVSPKFLDNNRILLNVTAKRDFFEEEKFGSFEQAVQTSKNQVTANVVLGFDQTLILSGLSEKETENVQDKVPILGDIPGLKYFFNEEKDLEFNKSVIFMLTPRRLIFINDEAVGQTKSTSLDTAKVKELLEQWRDYGITEPNIIHIMHHESDWIKKHVRAGDLSYRGWEQTDNIEFAINTAIERIYD